MVIEINSLNLKEKYNTKVKGVEFKIVNALFFFISGTTV